MKCFYHKSDLDGHCSGAIIKQNYPNCEMIGVDYKDRIKQFLIRPDETIFVVDFSFPMDDMFTLNNISTLHWIDHHKTSIDEVTKFKFIATGGQSLEIGKAGCELTWEYIYPSKPMPISVMLLGRYDVWDHKDLRVLPFQFGMRTLTDTHPDQIFLWSKIFNSNDYVLELINIGNIILNYQKIQDDMYAKGMSYETEFEGYRAIVLNKPFSNSKVFDSVYDPNKHDIMIIFGVKPKQIKYTLYSNKPSIDVSKIAKKYGGGGHKGAAGFYSDRLLF